LAPLAVYLADTGWTLLRRVFRGEAWYRPHRTHVYQRLTDVGWSHQRVAVTAAATAAAVSVCALIAAGGNPLLRVLIDLLTVGVLAGYLTSPALLAARIRRRTPGEPMQEEVGLYV
jgi:UDP-GlcNAc:undecaprenyl-phosphate/decaprenyl-phosphate GlcNAc-1-phosphate transferase